MKKQASRNAAVVSNLVANRINWIWCITLFFISVATKVYIQSNSYFQGLIISTLVRNIRLLSEGMPFKHKHISPNGVKKTFSENGDENGGIFNPNDV